MEGICRDREGGLRLNFVECSIDEGTKKNLFDKLIKDYGAVDVDLHEGVVYNNGLIVLFIRTLTFNIFSTCRETA